MIITDEIALAETLKEVKKSAKKIALATTEKKNELLEQIALAVEEQSDLILEANAIDVKATMERSPSTAFIDRLKLEGRLPSLINDIRSVAALPDPIGQCYDERALANGLLISKRRVPLGVIAVIYEARPNVTIDVATLALKSGNGIVLRGGKEAMETNRALVNAIHTALRRTELPGEVVAFIQSEDKKILKELLRMHEAIDLVVPRGGADLQYFCKENSSIPVITGGIGICHLFVDKQVDKEKALKVIHNAKTQRPTVCNALDTLLVHKAIAKEFIPFLVENLERSNVSFCLDPAAFELMSSSNKKAACRPALPRDWHTEWLGLTLGIKIVENVEEAIEHIQIHSSGHSDGILTDNEAAAEKFCREIDSALVYVNASTRFSDGGQLGLGSEVAVSTQKIHARGPMGLEALTSYKWVGRGDYSVRAPS